MNIILSVIEHLLVNFAKNKILLFLKEQTSLTTKEIRMSMKPYKEIYNMEKATFYNED